MLGSDESCCRLGVRLHGADDRVTSDLWHRFGDVRGQWLEGSVVLNVGRPFQVRDKLQVASHHALPYFNFSSFFACFTGNSFSCSQIIIEGMARSSDSTVAIDKMLLESGDCTRTGACCVKQKSHRKFFSVDFKYSVTTNDGLSVSF